MTTDQHPFDDRHDDADDVPASPFLDTPSGDQRDFWGDQGEWVTPVRAESDDTTRTMRRPSSLFGAVGAWADRALSSGVEPTRSHRVVRAGADDALRPVDGAASPVGDRNPQDRVAEVDLTQWDGDHTTGRASDGRDRHARARDDERRGGLGWDDPSRNTAKRDEQHQHEQHLDDQSWGDQGWDDGWDLAPVPAPRSGVDPLLARLGGLAVVLTLLVPFVLGMRSDGDDGQLRDAGVVTAEVDSTTVAPTTPAAEAGASSSVAAPSTIGDAGTPAAPVAEPDGDPVDDAAGTEPVARSSSLGDEATTALPPVTAPAEADEPADRVEPVCAAEYEVVSGDFWLRLAEAAGVDLADLLAVNGATSDTSLFPGRSICLPSGARTPAPPTTAAPTSPPATAAPTTAAPTTAAPTTTAPAPAPVAPGDVEQIIRNVWPDELEERALEIAWRESNYVPTAKNFCCYGLFQIYWDVHRGWLADLGVTTAEQLFDPTTNARAALALYERSGGWGPWGY